MYKIGTHRKLNSWAIKASVRALTELQCDKITHFERQRPLKPVKEAITGKIEQLSKHFIFYKQKFYL